MKKKKKVVQQVTVSPRMMDTQEELRRTYCSWEKSHPDSVMWKSAKAREQANWWDLAAAVCLQHDIPPALLVYMVFAHVNARAEDAEVPFSATTFRSEHLMLRALANWRSWVGNTLKHTQAIHWLDHGCAYEMPSSTLTLARDTAVRACRYFEINMEVLTYAATRGKYELDSEVWDLMAYQKCQMDMNPFLLLRVAKTPRVRALAAANAWILSDRQPWHRQVWEGIASPAALDRPEALAGDQNLRRFYRDGRLHTAWPPRLMPEAPFDFLDDPSYHRPCFHLSTISLCDKTDLFLAAKLHSARRGGP